MKKKEKNLITEFNDFKNIDSLEEKEKRLARILARPVKSNKELLEKSLRNLAETSDWDLNGHFHQFKIDENGNKTYYDGWDASNLDNDFKRNK